MLGKGLCISWCSCEGQGCFTGVNSLLPSCGSSEWNECHQTWHQAPLPAEPSHLHDLRALLVVLGFVFVFVHIPTSDMLGQYPLS